MAFNESQPSFPHPTDIECLKKALGLPSICLATTVNEVQCGTPISHKEKVDPILSSLLNPFDTTTIPGSYMSRTDQLLFRLLWVPLCPSRSQHSAPSYNMLSLDTLRDRFQKWKLSEEKDKANDEASTAGVGGCHESQTSALSEGFQRDTVHDAAFDSEKDNEHDEEDEDIDEDDASSHSEEQPSEYQSDEYQPSEQQNDKHSKGRTNNALDGKPTEVPKNKLCESLDEQLRQSRETLLHATDDQGPTSLATPPRTTNNSSKSESGSKDEPDSRSEASTPVPIIFSPSEPSFADTPDTEKTTSPTDWQDKDDYFDSPSLNRGPSARLGERLSIPPPAMSSLLQPKTPESHNEERPTTPFNSKNPESAGKYSTQRGRSVSTKKQTPRTPLHPSRTLADGTKTAEIWDISAKSNALRDILDTMRTIAKGDHGVPGHVYAYKHKSVPGHIKIGFAKDKGDSSEKSHVVLHPVGEHKDLHLWKRLKDQEFKCMSDMEVLFAVYMPCAAGQMERLVHHTLYEEKRIAHCQNSVCGRRHNEWFVVDKERAFEVISRWAEFSRLFPYDKIGSLGVSWHDHAHNYSKLSSSMTLEEWWNGPWSDFIEAQEIQHDQQLAAALDEKASSQQEETSLLDVQLEIQLERNKLQQEKNELEQYATTLREEKVKRDLDRTRERQQELQQRIEKLLLR
ncbi:unnamed protein product [Clonostachys rhizophaga]|uniref:Bacteriophage T5 Orf172 DNA-binding domain-containing protein n=1 Tax=Clonostachys rhizophaga TaxID=160324 RepID=A0A9N9W4G8_9HYPO|nr:unnamed protein product [Clonostachys rhizophaga]